MNTRIPSQRPALTSQNRKGSVLAATLFAAMIAAGSSALLSPSTASAQTVWNGASGTDLFWSTAANWTAGSPTSSSTGGATFNATGTAAAGVVTNEVTANISAYTLTFSNTGGAATAHTTQIDSGATLSVGTGSAAITQVNIGGGPVVGTTTATNVVIAGLGVLTVSSSGSTSLFRVASVTSGTYASATDQVSTLDMSGLATFSLSLSGGTTASLSIGESSIANAKEAGIVKLATTNTITVNAITVGVSTSSGTGSATTSSLDLGQTNTIKSNTITVGAGKSSGTLQFATGLTGATATIADRAGTGAANLVIGNVAYAANTGSSSTGSVDLTGGAVTANLGTVTIGGGATSAGVGQGTGTLSFGAGSNITANAVTLANYASSSNASAATGTINQSGGTATITTLTLGNRTGTGTGAVNATYNLSASTLSAGSIVAGSGTATRTINWTGGTIKSLSASDLTIGSGVSVAISGAGNQTFTVDSGRSITLNGTVDGTGTFAKSGAGSFNLNASNIIADTVNLKLAGGTFAQGVGFSETLGSLDLDAASAITLGAGGSLFFANSSALDWNSSALSITGSFTNGSVRFGSDSTGLTSAQLALISINGQSAALDTSGFLVTAVPEPSTYALIAGAIALGVVAYRRRRA